MRNILVMDNGAESTEAEKFLASNGIPYEIVRATSFWPEIGYPIPTLFTNSRAFKGLEEIRKAKEALGYGKPS